MKSAMKSAGSKLRVLLADDHRLVRLGFRRLLEDEADMEVVGEAGNGIEAIELAESLRPDLIVLDMAMPELDGLQAIHEIVRRSPETKILILSMYDEPRYVRNAIQAGAHGYLLKNAVDVGLAEGVRAVAAGRRYLSKSLESIELDGEASDDPLERLTNRERQILQLVAQARSNKEIAQILDISVNTVNVHRTNLMKALNLHSTAELVLFGVKHGLVTLPD
ncbi:MAG TPA: response regulator transcription factor [Bryobacterales bacterium]|nr:response regulator transcription factor [Bryobacterales bacterium]